MIMRGWMLAVACVGLVGVALSTAAPASDADPEIRQEGDAARGALAAPAGETGAGETGAEASPDEACPDVPEAAPPGAGAAVPEAAPVSIADLVIDRLTWTGEARPGAVLEVRNDYGDIRARHSEDGKIDVLAVVQRLYSVARPDVDARRNAALRQAGLE